MWSTSDGGASISERGLTEFLGGDAWFCALGLVVGALIGLGGWRWFRDLGWPLVLGVCGLAVAASLVCWLVGYQLGPGEFAPRLAAAAPGDLVPIELTLRAKASLLVWPFVAVVPVLLGSSLGRDDEEPRPLLRRKSVPVSSGVRPAGERLGTGGSRRSSRTPRRRSAGSDPPAPARPRARACRQKRGSWRTRWPMRRATVRNWVRWPSGEMPPTT